MTDYFDKIQKSNKLAEQYLNNIRLAALDYEEFQKNFRKYLLAKYMLDETEAEIDLYKLAVLSIKKNVPSSHAVNNGAIDERLQKYDCHRVNSAVAKKVLFIMNVERQLEVSLDNDEAAAILTIDDLTQCVYSKYRKTKELV